MEENKNLNEEVDTKDMTKEELEKLANDTIEKIRNQAMVLGYRVACKTIVEMIAPWHNPHSSHNDYKRLFKKVEEFCGKVLRQDENTVQN